MDDDEDIREVQHFGTIIRAYDNYRSWALTKVAKLEYDFGRLSEQHRRVLRTAEKLTAMRAAIDQNASIIARLVEPHREYVASDVAHMFVLANDDQGSMRAVPAAGANYVPEADMEKVQSTLEQFVREWGAEGEKERNAAHEPLLEALQAAPPPTSARGKTRVLLPGSGLGRLTWEVARLGYAAQGCEFSYFMLLASNFIMNRIGEESITVHPWVLQTCNARSTADSVRPAQVPDVMPATIEAASNLSICAGDFLEIYREQLCRWDAIVTCFFIDTAHDITKYIEKIAEMMVPGAVWINIGPLLWHWSDMVNEVSIELTWEELRALIISYGFVIEREEWRRCGYTHNAASMYKMEYDCIFFVARWPAASHGHTLPPPPPQSAGSVPPPPPNR